MKSSKILNGIKNRILRNLIIRMLEQSRYKDLYCVSKFKKTYFLFLVKLITYKVKTLYCDIF